MLILWFTTRFGAKGVCRDRHGHASGQKRVWLGHPIVPIRI